MINTALVFPGQGAQRVGMGKEFYDASSPAKEVFDAAERILGPGFLDVIFNGPAEKLTSTAFCQPAIFTTSIAVLSAFQAHPKFKNINVRFTAGLSLGEYSALVASGALSFEDGLKLVRQRAALMEEATKITSGKMAAIIGFDKEKLRAICAQVGAQIANFNSPEQIVITGHAEKVDAACVLIKAEGAKSVIPLEVSGAFHSSLMQPAAEKFKKVLTETKINPAKIPVIANVNALPQTNPDDIRKNLSLQITSSVLWDDSVRTMAGQGITDFIEIGPGTVLKGLMRKINPVLKVSNIQNPQDVENIVS